MFLESSFTETFDVADKFCKQKLSVAMTNITPSGPSLRFETFDDLYANEDYLDQIFFIEEGAVSQRFVNVWHHDGARWQLVHRNSEFVEREDAPAAR